MRPVHDLVRFEEATEQASGLVLAVPRLPGVVLTAWIAQHRELVEAKLQHFGAVLFRGFGIDSPSRLAEVTKAISGDCITYEERRSPRNLVGDQVYTSTLYPANQRIHLHNESSYAHQFPMRLHFSCVRPADSGGETPLADSRRVLSRISASTREAFERLGVGYLRNFYDGLGMSWQETFQTPDPSEVESYCREANISCRWDKSVLRTWQTRPAIVTHPNTGERVWFNQAHLFHTHSLPHDIEALLLSQYSPDALPEQAFFGDGAAISDSMIEEIMDCYQAEEVTFGWRRGDLLVLDNMLVAHSRNPYRGERFIALTLSNLCTFDAVQKSPQG
jgi:alpha-ketoglutarate-dependent taurine dioxygenase